MWLLVFIARIKRVLLCWFRWLPIQRLQPTYSFIIKFQNEETEVKIYSTLRFEPEKSVLVNMSTTVHIVDMLTQVQCENTRETLLASSNEGTEEHCSKVSSQIPQGRLHLKRQANLSFIAALFISNCLSSLVFIQTGCCCKAHWMSMDQGS